MEKKTTDKPEPPPCTSPAPQYKKGDQLEIVAIKNGHVLAFLHGPRQPDSQVAHCIGCGKSAYQIEK